MSATALAAIATLGATGALAAGPASAGTGLPTIGGGNGFPSGTPARTVIRISIDPRSARSLSNLSVVECFHGTCLFATPLTGLGFFQASFAVTPPLGERVRVLVVACSRLGCVRGIRGVLVSQPGSG